MLVFWPFLQQRNINALQSLQKCDNIFLLFKCTRKYRFAIKQQIKLQKSKLTKNAFTFYISKLQFAHNNYIVISNEIIHISKRPKNQRQKTYLENSLVCNPVVG
jgi:hypothetical protein